MPDTDDHPDHPSIPDALTLDPVTIDNVLLRRLVEEVQQDEVRGPQLYDRVHNRHNRGGPTRPWPTPPRPTPPRPTPPRPTPPRPAPEKPPEEPVLEP